MQIIDMFLHAIDVPQEEILFKIEDDIPALINNKNAWILQNNLEKAMMVLFDGRLALGEIENIPLSFPRSIALSLVPCLKMEEALMQINNLLSFNLKSVTFHPYLQQISSERYDVVRKIAKEAAKMGLFICICSAYGSKSIYKYNSLDLAVYLAEKLECPIVLSHAGGAKILEAMLIADSFANIFLETSFSLPYWLGSSVEQDFAFAMRKLGVNRWMFGSDHPFVSLSKAIEEHLEFFKKYRFSDKEIEVIMGKNAARLLGV